jgi:8-oxo-dGTP pyrophosphatase MutT (NUDIX family)
VDVTEVVRAAGGVVWRPGVGGEPEIVLVHRPKYDDWSFPKGKLHAGETELAAALREVEEETGLRGRPIRDLGLSHYRDSAGRPKTVRYWEMRPTDGDLAPAHEIDEARWASLREADALLTYDRDREMLERFRRMVARQLTESRVE